MGQSEAHATCTIRHDKVLLVDRFDLSVVTRNRDCNTFFVHANDCFLIASLITGFYIVRECRAP